ncbi:hypothetical protein [Levilactobacillus acidifarinae]|uniref:Uncharacterized protein n=1 Tax=Levilactobacillus acidifarinae DSM 19394 = JCM 15949 TaxID=1423715 RepID=A0A0R1LJR7_9LACO|nr:hypothetical protein [Levilactobacillus acidifarinae]KRK96150.1 hypothetical protein FD25_GL002616 [Levilactobacillus acidifarinae DSM 19394]GEO69511.1 hypothetical protein LAC03_14210 [Levilactobacillus acidifarinae]
MAKESENLNYDHAKRTAQAFVTRHAQTRDLRALRTMINHRLRGRWRWRFATLPNESLVMVIAALLAAVVTVVQIVMFLTLDA